MSSRPLASADWAIDPLLNETAVISMGSVWLLIQLILCQILLLRN